MSICSGCRPNGSPPSNRWSISTSTNPRSQVKVIASITRAKSRWRTDAGVGRLSTAGGYAPARSSATLATGSTGHRVP